MRMTANNTGFSKWKALIVLAMLVIGFSEGLKLLDVYLDFERMKDTMETKASVAQVLKDEEIRNDLVAKAKDLDLPLTGESFILDRDEQRRKMTIKTAWDTEVSYLWGLYVHTYHFEPVAVENIGGR